jgi:protein gp37
MGDSTGISWTDATWNPVRGCSRVSEGCRNCYAERVAARFSGPGQPYDGLVSIRAARPLLGDDSRHLSSMARAKWNGNVRFIPEHLADPLRWRRPRRIFVNSMSDLFHENLDDDVIDRVFAVMLLAPHHTFQILTKRAARLRSYFDDSELYERVVAAADELRRQWPRLNQIGISNPATNPASWIWIGVSVENQAAADERIPDLLRTPAAVRFLSCEPLLGAIDLDPRIGRIDHCGSCGAENHPQKPDRCPVCAHENCLTSTWGDEQHQLLRDGERYSDDSDDSDEPFRNGPELHWVIAGCESGPGARHCDVAWLRSLRDQCASAGVPYFLKQAVGGARFTAGPGNGHLGVSFDRGSKRKSGGLIELPYLDGFQHAAFPDTHRK